MLSETIITRGFNYNGEGTLDTFEKKIEQNVALKGLTLEGPPAEPVLMVWLVRYGLVSLCLQNNIIQVFHPGLNYHVPLQILHPVQGLK